MRCKDAPKQNNFIDGTTTSQRSLGELAVECLRAVLFTEISLLPQITFGTQGCVEKRLEDWQRTGRGIRVRVLPRDLPERLQTVQTWGTNI